MEYTSIATHDGSFHADDVLSVAILVTIYPNHHIVRTRDPDVLSLMDVVVDVGGMYHHVGKRYDHHMSPPPCDKFGHVLSSSGLIWRHYAKTYLESIGIPKDYTLDGHRLDIMEAVERSILTDWIYPIDRADNGLSDSPTAISELIKAMRPIGPEKSRQRFNGLFIDTVSMVSHLFQRACFHAADYAVAKFTCVHQEKTYLADNRIVISPQPIPNPKIFIRTPVHFAIFPCQEYNGDPESFIVRPILEQQSKVFKTSFPASVLGVSREVIARELGIEGISYIHHTGFVAHTDTQEAAVSLCEYLLNHS